MSSAATTGAERRALRRTARRLGLQTAALVLACLVVVASVVLLVVTRAQEEAARQQLEAAVRSIDDAHEAPPGLWVAVASPRAMEVSDALPTGLPDLDAMRRVVSTGGDVWSSVRTDVGTVPVLTGRNGDRVVQVAQDPREVQEELHRLVAALIVAGAVGVVLAGLGASWFTGRAVQPMVAALSLQRRFVADASHELRTPLTLLSTRAELLDRHLSADWGTTSRERVRHDVDGLLADAAALTAVLDDMLLAADARSVDAVPVDATALVAEVVEAAGASAEEHGVQITRHGAGSVSVLAAPTSLRRAVVALVDNAIEHARTAVEVDVTGQNSQVRIEVRDDGPGLPPAQDQLFRRFASFREERADAERRHYGIGLALVAEVATQHGGTVTAGPRADGLPGAAVTLELPAPPSGAARRG